MVFPIDTQSKDVMTTNEAYTSLSFVSETQRNEEIDDDDYI